MGVTHGGICINGGGGNRGSSDSTLLTHLGMLHIPSLSRSSCLFQGPRCHLKFRVLPGAAAAAAPATTLGGGVALASAGHVFHPDAVNPISARRAALPTGWQ